MQKNEIPIDLCNKGGGGKVEEEYGLSGFRRGGGEGNSSHTKQTEIESIANFPIQGQFLILFSNYFNFSQFT